VFCTIRDDNNGLSHRTGIEELFPAGTRTKCLIRFNLLLFLGWWLGLGRRASKSPVPFALFGVRVSGKRVNDCKQQKNKLVLVNYIASYITQPFFFLVEIEKQMEA
jgi:hypothetical protein